MKVHCTKRLEADVNNLVSLTSKQQQREMQQMLTAVLSYLDQIAGNQNHDHAKPHTTEVAIGEHNIQDYTRSFEKKECDMYHGKWVYDNSYPLYGSSQCNFIGKEFACQRNGRPDRLYLKYRWQPSACNLPRWDFIQEGKHMQKDMDRLVAYEKGLMTWARWVDTNVDPEKTKVFFQGVSPDHSNGSYWPGNNNGKDCKGETKPMLAPGYPNRQHPGELVLKKVLHTMTKPLHLLNVTRLSQQRKDAHPSVYGLGGHRGMDCSHWCLAGLPDTWNQLLYAELISK
nr:protein trichome birefringence-like 43 [Quercus suber]